MPFEQLLGANDIVDIRQALGDVASGTFGQKEVVRVTLGLDDSTNYGESPVETPVTKTLKGLIITQEATDDSNVERSTVDWDMSIMFFRDYLDEEGLLSLFDPVVFDRNDKWQVDNQEYEVVRYRWDAQLVDEQLLLFVELKRL